MYYVDISGQSSPKYPFQEISGIFREVRYLRYFRVFVFSFFLTFSTLL